MTSRPHNLPGGVADAELELNAIETLAVELANLAGAEVITRLGSVLNVRYKSLSPEEAYRDPVSEVDHNVETLIRARLSEVFPEHDIIGEEIDERPGRDHDFVWAVDPLDGTTNFVNGFPLFASSIGVLYRGYPVVGAVWSTFTHRLRPGVYHARIGGQFCFDGRAAASPARPTVRRGLAGLPDRVDFTGPWQVRKTGSAAVECAMVAAGGLQIARFDSPNIWDVAAGIVLAKAAGMEVRERTAKGWTAFERFAGDKEDAKKDLAEWRNSLVLGTLPAVEIMCAGA